MVDRTPDEALAAVTADDSRTDSLILLFSTTKQQLADALSGVRIPPEVQAKINSIFDLSTGTAAKIDTALNTNVPPPVVP